MLLFDRTLGVREFLLDISSSRNPQNSLPLTLPLLSPSLFRYNAISPVLFSLPDRVLPRSPPFFPPIKLYLTSPFANNRSSCQRGKTSNVYTFFVLEVRKHTRTRPSFSPSCLPVCLPSRPLFSSSFSSPCSRVRKWAFPGRWTAFFKIKKILIFHAEVFISKIWFKQFFFWSQIFKILKKLFLCVDFPVGRDQLIQNLMAFHLL